MGLAWVHLSDAFEGKAGFSVASESGEGDACSVMGARQLPNVANSFECGFEGGFILAALEVEVCEALPCCGEG